MDQLTAYQILGISPSSSEEDIREAFRNLSQSIHPEEQPEEFARIQAAYRLLTQRHPYAFQQAAVQQQPAPIEEQEEQAFFSSLDHERIQENLENRQRLHELEDLRNIVVYGKLISDPNYLMYLLERYPLSRKQYAQLKQRLTSGTESIILQKCSIKKEILDFIRIGAGSRPMTKREKIFLAGILLILIALGFLAKGGIISVVLGIALFTMLFYPRLRANASVFGANSFLCFCIFIIGASLLISDVEFISILGFILFMLAPLWFLVMAFQAILQALRRRKTKEPSSLDNP